MNTKLATANLSHTNTGLTYVYNTIQYNTIKLYCPCKGNSFGLEVAHIKKIKSPVKGYNVKNGINLTTKK